MRSKSKRATQRDSNNNSNTPGLLSPNEEEDGAGAGATVRDSRAFSTKSVASTSSAPTTSNNNNMEQLYLFVEMVSTFRLPAYEEDEETRKERADARRERSFNNNNNFGRGRSSTTASNNSNANSAATPNTAAVRQSSSFLGFLTRSNAPAAAPAAPQAAVDPVPQTPTKRSKSRDKKDKDKLAGPVENIEMCTAWAMIPIAELIATTATPNSMTGQYVPISKPFLMHGGTPFMNVNIRDKDIVLRAGTWQMMKRTMGYQVKSKLSILVTPPSRLNTTTLNATVTNGGTAPAALATGERPRSMGFLSSPVKAATPTPAGPAPGPGPAPGSALRGSLATAPGTITDPTKPTKVDDTKLISLLPPQLLCPANGVTLVGIYRAMLRDSLAVKLDAPDRILPQSGVTIHQDVILGSFPRILADPATCSVLLKLWGREAPDRLTKKSLSQITVTDVSSKQVLDVFHDVVLKVYRTLHCLDAQPDRFNPFETAEQLYKREELIRRLCGLTTIPPTGNMLKPGTTSTINNNNNPNGANNNNSNANVVEDVDITQVLYAPFNSKELHWNRP